MVSPGLDQRMFDVCLRYETVKHGPEAFLVHCGSRVWKKHF